MNLQLRSCPVAKGMPIIILEEKNNIQSSDAAMIGLRRDLSMRGQLIEPRSL